MCLKGKKKEVNELDDPFSLFLDTIVAIFLSALSAWSEYNDPFNCAAAFVSQHHCPADFRSA